MLTRCPADRVRKIVRFAEENSVIVFTSEEAESPLWRESGDSQASRKSVRDEADVLKPKGYGSLLKRCFDPGPNVQRQINALAQLPDTDCPRGSEQYLSRQHAEECDWIKSKVRVAVLTRQRVLLKKKMSADDISEKLRSVSKKHSRASRIFARRLGIADERAVKEGDDPKKARALVKSLNLGNAKTVKRRNSLTKAIDLTEDHGVAKITGLSHKVSSRFDSHKTKRSLLAPTKPVSSESCANMIQSALDLLEFDGDDDFFSQPSNHEVAISA